MKIPIELLLALKATQIGIAVANSPSKHQAKLMVESAINIYENKNDFESKLRLIFYLGTKAAINREDNNYFDDRVNLKNLCDECNSEFYQWFMSVQNATLKTTGYGNFGLTAPLNDDSDNPLLSPLGRVKIALTRWVLPEGKLTANEENFLAHVSLAQILKKHGIS